MWWSEWTIEFRSNHLALRLDRCERGAGSARKMTLVNILPYNFIFSVLFGRKSFLR